MSFRDLLDNFHLHKSRAKRVVNELEQSALKPYRAKAEQFMKEENRIAIIVLFVIIVAAIVVGDAIPPLVFGLLCAAVGGGVICYIIVKNDLW